MYAFKDPDDPKYRIVVVSPREAILTVEHACGHIRRYSFKTSRAAEDLVDYYLNEQCAHCSMPVPEEPTIDDPYSEIGKQID